MDKGVGMLPLLLRGKVANILKGANAISEYRMDEGVGNIVDEISGITGTLAGTASWAAQGLAFDGAGWVTDPTKVPATPPFSCFWVMSRTASDAVKNRIFSQGGWGGNTAFIAGFDPTTYMPAISGSPWAWNFSFIGNDKWMGSCYPTTEYFSVGFSINTAFHAILLVNGNIVFETDYASGINITQIAATFAAFFDRASEMLVGKIVYSAIWNKVLSIIEFRRMHYFVRLIKPILALSEPVDLPTYFRQDKWHPQDSTTGIIIGSEVWELMSVADMSIILDGGIYYGYYTGVRTVTEAQIGLATCATPIGTWVKDVGNPLIPIGGAGEFDKVYAHKPSFLKVGATYYLYYIGLNDVDWKKKIGLATAAAPGGPWTKHASNPLPTLLPSGVNNTWNKLQIDAVDVIHDGTLFHLFCSGMNDEAHWNTWSIGHYTSIDGITWTADPANPVFGPNPAHPDEGYYAGAWDYGWVAPGHVYYDPVNHLWVMSYNGGATRGITEGGPWNAGLAYNTSLYGQWTRSPLNPIISSADWSVLWDGRILPQWDQSAIWRARIYEFGGTKYIYYNANGIIPERIGYAIYVP